MNRAEIVIKLTAIARDIFRDDNLTLSDNNNASNTEGWTSLNFMRLLEAVEKEFGFKFKMMELMGINDMGALITAIEKHI